ncbi:MAG: hypothetical protein H6673_00025 [Anaerolineales bacterium]|nr:hypothetical protein [Anaerolineales bacterium]
MFSYIAYDLIIQSDFSLPELTHIETRNTKPDITIRRVSPQQLPSQLLTQEGYSIVNHYQIGINHPAGLILVQNGHEILIAPSDNVEPKLLSNLITASALDAALLQRKFFLIHGSAVEIGGIAVAFIGETGYGKSTTAATFAAAQYPLLSDDTLAINMNRMTLHPAYPQIKLWPDSAEAVGQSPDELPKLYSLAEKRALRLQTEAKQQPIPLRQIYVLARDDYQHSVEPLSFSDSFTEILRHSYIGHLQYLYKVDLLTYTGQTEQHFRDCAKVAGMIRCYKLKRRWDLANVHELVNVVINDLHKHEVL